MFFSIPLLCFAFSCAASQHLSVHLSNVSHLSVGEGRLFASSGCNIYTFSSRDLVQIQSTSLGIKVLALGSTADDRWLIVCLKNGTCSILDGNNTQLSPKKSINVFEPGFQSSDESLTLLVAHSFTNDTSVLTGSYSGKRIRYSQFGLEGSSSAGMKSTAVPKSNYQGRHYHGGFIYMEYAYYVIVDSTDSVFEEIRIVRLCLEGSLHSQNELVLTCPEKDFLEIFVTSVSILEDRSLLILGTRFSNGGNDKAEKVCFYNLTEVNSLMDKAYQECVISGNGMINVRWVVSMSQDCNSDVNSDGSPSLCDFKTSNPLAIAHKNPLPSTNQTFDVCGLTVVTAVSISDIDLVYTVLKNCTNDQYHINKYHLTNDSVVLIGSIKVDNEVKLLMKPESSGPEYIFAVTSSQILAFKVSNCADLLNCGDCVLLGNALCGWCLFEARCSMMASCSDLFITDKKSCFSNITLEPSTFTAELQTPPYKIHVNIEPPILLLAEEWFCIFNTTEQTNYQIQTPFNGSYCFINDVVDKVESSLSTTFTLYNYQTATHVYKLEEEYIFFNCHSFTECTSCVESLGECGWCALDFTCTVSGDNCTGGEMKWLTYPAMSIVNETSYVCPLLIDQEYSLPVGIGRNLNLMTLNAWSHSSELEYMCRIGEADIQGELISSSIVQCRIGPGEILLAEGNSGIETRPMSLRQVHNGKAYNMEVHGQETLMITLYDCLALAGSCSKCLSQNINTGFECGWCSDQGQCMVGSRCQRLPILSSGDCDKPVIKSFNPPSAPAGEDVTLTITGTDLGVVFSDLLMITLGNCACVANETSYEAGEFIECYLESTSESYGEDYIHIVVNTTIGEKTAQSEVMFVYIAPTIGSVSPSFGPTSGGTLVLIRGNSLDVGGRNRTAVLMRNDSRKMEFQCDIIQLNSTIIFCQTSPTTCSCLMHHVIKISSVYFNFSHTFLYKPDPIFSFLTTKVTIIEGGINLTFEGTDLNSVHSPSIRINDTRFRLTEESCIGAADGLTMNCIAPPIVPYNNGVVHIYSIIGYSVVVDGAQGPDAMLPPFTLVLIKTPLIRGLNQYDRTRQVGTTGDLIQIEGDYIESVAVSEILVYVGKDECVLDSVTDQEILCHPPVKHSESVERVKVLIGLNLVFSFDGPEWFIVYYSNSNPSPDHTVALISGTLALLLILTAVFGSVGGVVMYCHCKRKKQKAITRFNSSYTKEDLVHIYSSVRSLRRTTKNLQMTEENTELEKVVSDCNDSSCDAVTDAKSTSPVENKVKPVGLDGEYEIMRPCHRIMPDADSSSDED